MNTCYLCKNIVTNDRHVFGYAHTRIAFNYFAYIENIVFVDVSFLIQMIMNECYHTCQRCIPSSLTQSVHGNMHTFCASFDGFVNIGNSQVIIVVGMKIEMKLWVTCHHFGYKLFCFIRIENAQCVGQHETTNGLMLQLVHQMIYIFFRILHPIRPIFQINIDSYTHLFCMANHIFYFLEMLLYCLIQLEFAMFE